MSSSERPLADAWFRALPFVPESREELQAARSRLVQWDGGEAATRSTQPSAFYSGHNGVHRVLKTYLLGRLDTRLGDTDRAAVRAAELDSAGRTADGPPLALELAQGLQAGIALANGRSDSALADLEALRIEGWYELTFVSPFYSGAMERFTRRSCSGSKAAARKRSDGTVASARTRRRSWSSSDRRCWPKHGSSGHSAGRAKRPDCMTRFVALWRECDPDSRSLLDQAIAERTALSGRT